MKILLDTHTVLWAAEGDARLGSATAKFLRDLEIGEAVISDISLVEIAMLEKKRRISLRISIADYLLHLQRRFPIVPIAPQIAADAFSLDLPHADPFDRIIVATARWHKLPLATRDRVLRSSNLVKTIW